MNKIINVLKTENIDLKMHNEKLKIENLEKNISISKLKSDKFLLFNELNELVNSLKTIDLKILNKFYKKIHQNRILTRNDMPSSLGIKYNIITAQNQLALLMHSDLIASKSFNETYNKINETLSDEKNNLKTDYNYYEKEKANKEFIDLENYVKVIGQFEKDFQKNFDRNIKIDKMDMQF